MTDLLLEIDTAGDAPVFKQIADGIRDHLLRGLPKPGDVLPSVRELAARLGVHFNTVAQAYRSLEADGWVQVRRKRGTLVLEREKPSLSPAETEALSRRFNDDFKTLAGRYIEHGLSVAQLEQITAIYFAQQRSTP